MAGMEHCTKHSCTYLQDEGCGVCKREEGTASRAIVSRADVMGGQPCFEGTRIPVKAVLSFAREGYSEAEILREYPTLTAADVCATLTRQRED